jgi:hypothetical protein
MSKLRCILVVLATLTLCLSCAVLVEDDPETPFDESESLPYEMTPLLFGDVVQEPAPTPQVMPIGRSDGLTRLRRPLGRTGSRKLAPHHITDSLVVLYHTLRC